MNRLLTYSLVVTCFVLASCSESFLEPEPLSFFAPENVFVDKAGYEAQLVTMRKNLTTEHMGGRGTSLIHTQWIFGETHIGGAFMDMDRLNPNVSADWFNVNGALGVMYQFIKDANVIITRIDDIEWENEQDRNEILAEALWHRSYWYNRMVHSYGDVPFIGEEVTSPRVDFKTHTRGAILDKIQEDLEWALTYLPESAAPGEITRYAGYHLLTRIALANKEFDTAIDAATTVINGPHDLMTERFGVDANDPERNIIWDLHRPQNVNASANTETILAIVDRYSDPDDVKTSGSWYQYHYNPSWHHSRVADSEGGQCTYRPTTAEADTLQGGEQWKVLGQGGTSAVPNQFFQYHLWEEGDYTFEDTPDLRRRAGTGNWWEVDEILCNVPSSPDYGQPAINGTVGGGIQGLIHTSLFAANVYKTYHPERDGTPLGGNADMYIFRLAETYLLRAEAYHWTGQEGLAADDINQVRERAGAEPISASEVDIDLIFDETLRELFFETPRQNELARVAFYMGEEGINGYDYETLHQSNWAYDRIIRTNDWYPQYDGPYVGELTPHGNPLPLGEQYRFASGLTPRINPHNFLWPIADNFIDANTQGVINQNKGYVGADRNEPPLETIED